MSRSPRTLGYMAGVFGFVDRGLLLVVGAEGRICWLDLVLEWVGRIGWR